MSFTTLENSVQDAEPIEAYRFTGTLRSYRYTSAEEDILLGGEIYLATPGLQRLGAEAGTHTDDRVELQFQLPFDVEVVADYAYAVSPPNLLLEVFRAHRSSDLSVDFKLLWKGEVTSFSVQGDLATVHVPSTFSRALQANVPGVRYQNPCNHVLYDGRCQASKAANTETAVVTVVGTEAIEVDDDGFADGYLKAGEMINTRTKERRLIISNVVNVVGINFPFIDIVVGDIVELVAGCDHLYTTCGSKFSNIDNYGGHPFIPTDNPFIGEL